MRLTACPACSNLVSPKAAACPKCGQPVNQPRRAGTICKGLGLVGMIFGVVVGMGSVAANMPLVGVFCSLTLFGGFGLAVIGRFLD